MMKNINSTFISAVAVTIVLFTFEFVFGFGGNFSVSDLDPTNKDSAVRKGSKELDPTNKNSAVRKGAKELDVTNKNSAIRKGGKELDPFNKNSAVRKGLKEADPLNRNSAAGRYLNERKKVLQKEYNKQKERINQGVGATTERIHKKRKQLQSQGQAVYNDISRETQNSVGNVYDYTEQGIEKATAGIQEAEERLRAYRREKLGNFDESVFDSVEAVAPVEIQEGLQSISIKNFKKGVQKLPGDIANSKPAKSMKKWGAQASVGNLPKTLGSSMDRLGSSREMKTVRKWRTQGGQAVLQTGRVVDERVLQPSADGLKSAGRFVDENITRPLIVDPISGMLNSEIIVYDFTTHGSFTVNLSTGAYWMRLDLPMGMAVDSTDFENWLQGKLAIPNFDPIEIATQGTITNKNGYHNFRSGYRGDSTYVASKRFVDWFSLETATNELLQAYFTAGQSTQSSMEALRQYFELEWNDLYSWLEAQGIEYVEEASLQLFQSIISGQPVQLDNLGLSASLVNVPYAYELDINIDPRLADLLDQVGVDVPGSGQPLADSPHMAFVVSLQGMKKQNGHAEKTERLERVLARGPQSLDSVLQSALMKDSYPAIKAMFAGGGGGTLLQGSMVNNILTNQIGLGNYLGSGGSFMTSRMDLQGSQVGANIKRLISQLTFGNQGIAHLKKLQLDLDTLQISCEIQLKHKHSWGSLSDIQAGFAEFARKTGKQINLDTLLASQFGQ